VKSTLPVMLGVLVGCYMVVEYFIPHYAVRDVTAHVLEWGGIVAASAYVIGGINVVQVTWPKIRRRESDWGYKVVLLGSAAIMAIVGLPWRSMTGTTREPGWAMRLAPSPELVRAHRARVIVEAPDDVITSVGPRIVAGPNIVTIDPGEIAIKAGRRAVGYDTFEGKISLHEGDVAVVAADPQMAWGANGRVRTWLYDYVFAPCNATMFALLAFFVASAAFRAFRARNVEAALLLGSAIIVLLAQAPIGRWITTALPHLSDWILDILSNGSRRAIIMGAAVGAIATGLRVILGIERSHLGGDA
jgi:hypothetical protein